MTLSNGWVLTKLGDVSDFVMGQAPPGNDCNNVGRGTPFVKAGEFGAERPQIREWTTRPLKMALSSDVLICVVGATAGKLNLGADCAIGRSVAAIRPSGASCTNFIYSRLKLEVQKLRSASTGTAQGLISREMLAEIPIALPPLAEQRRIVAKLDALTARIARTRAELERVHHLADQLRKRFLRTEIDRAYAVNGSIRAGDLFSWSSGKFLPRSNQNGGQFPVFGGNGINGFHDRANSHQSTLVIGRVGAQCGNVHLTAGDAWITDNAIFARQTSATVDLRFALHLFRSADLIQKAAGTGQPYVNQEALSSVFYPKFSRAEQLQVGAKIDAVFARADRLEAEAARALKLLDRLEASILAKAFRGELVPQDPLEEQASVLLDRIRAARSAAPKRTRGRRATVASG